MTAKEFLAEKAIKDALSDHIENVKANLTNIVFVRDGETKMWCVCELHGPDHEHICGRYSTKEKADAALAEAEACPNYELALYVAEMPWDSQPFDD